MKCILEFVEIIFWNRSFKINFREYIFMELLVILPISLGRKFFDVVIAETPYSFSLILLLGARM